MAEKTKSQQRKDTSKTMSLWGHIRELRICLAVIAVTYVAAACACYCFAPEFITWAISLAQGYTFVQTGVAELLAQYIKVALIAGVVVDAPIIFWQLMRFVGPGLKRSEEIKLLVILFGGVFLFAVGTGFATLIVIPFTLQFFLSLNTIHIGGMYSIKEYISYLVSVLFSFGLIFEIPVVAAVLTAAGLLKPHWMRSARRAVVVICFLVGAVITPPDVASQVLVAVPMYLLFELSVVICSLVYRRRCAKLRAAGLDPEQVQEQSRGAKHSRWAAAKAAVERRDARNAKQE